MQCDMCGRGASLIKVKVEGSEMEVCKPCSSFGTVIIPTRIKLPRKKTFQKTNSAELLAVVADYGARIRKAREKLGLNQEAFAKKVKEKHSIIQKIETNNFKPSVHLAKKFERMLKIKLTEESNGEETKLPEKQASSRGFTLGDFIKRK